MYIIIPKIDMYSIKINIYNKARCTAIDNITAPHEFYE